MLIASIVLCITQACNNHGWSNVTTSTNIWWNRVGPHTHSAGFFGGHTIPANYMSIQICASLAHTAILTMFAKCRPSPTLPGSHSGFLLSPCLGLAHESPLGSCFFWEFEAPELSKGSDPQGGPQLHALLLPESPRNQSEGGKGLPSGHSKCRETRSPSAPQRPPL